MCRLCTEQVEPLLVACGCLLEYGDLLEATWPQEATEKRSRDSPERPPRNQEQLRCQLQVSLTMAQFLLHSLDPSSVDSPP